MSKAVLLLIFVAIAASGCANGHDFAALERHTQLEQAAATQPAVRGPSHHFDGNRLLENTGMAFTAAGAFLSLAWLDQMLDPNSGPTVAADYSPTETRKEVRGH